MNPWQQRPEVRILAAGARRRRHVDHRHRAPPGCGGERRLDHRPRSGAAHVVGRIVFEAPRRPGATRSTLTG